jgi:hypothetical protein
MSHHNDNEMTDHDHHTMHGESSKLYFGHHDPKCFLLSLLWRAIVFAQSNPSAKNSMQIASVASVILLSKSTR